MDTKRLMGNQRLCRAMTGLSGAEIKELEPIFEPCLLQHRYELLPKADRQRKLGGGRKGKLPTTLDKLVFVLIYLKIYPTYDVLSFLTDRARSKCFRSVHQLLPVLEKALGRKLALPERQVTSVEEFFRLFPEAKDVFLDGTERPVQKPVSQKRRKKLYSGKKKQTTRKTIVLTDTDKKILVLTKTKSGRRHDKRLADKISLVEHVPEAVALWVDSGGQGMQKLHENTLLPVKGTKKKPLTEEQKAANHLQASFRVVVEHAIGDMKRFKSAADIYRNRLPNLDDTFFYLAAGLWNYHLQANQQKILLTQASQMQTA